MAKIEIPNKFLKDIGNPVAMDLHVINVYLTDGRKFKKLAVRGGTYITGYANDPEGISNLNFKSVDIKKVKRPFFW